jgi:hypothetical protein
LSDGGSGGTGEVVVLVENEHYYMDDGLMVFTGCYHLRRGYCCGAGLPSLFLRRSTKVLTTKHQSSYDEAPKGNNDGNVESNEETK